MNGQPPPLPPFSSTPPPLPDPSRPPGRPCLWVGSMGCVTLAVVLAVIVVAVILLVKFVWELRLDQWL